MDELTSVYIQECREQLADMEAGLLRLEQAPDDRDNLNGIFRAAHTIKGGAGGPSVDQFAALMKAKLAQARVRGKSGWRDLEWPSSDISRQLREHVDKGDPVDVANYAMFLALRNERVTR